ncbi:MAG: HDOD domain-containing protein [Bythopirellula sp.]|nr:HDOD domain-containing protein [Bythopirellula sp.]
MLTPTGFSPLSEQSTPLTIESMVARARALYTLPTVAAEVLELTANPNVEPQAIKECILRDPALTAKILRVVNSSLFGLSGEVRDLNQAIALLGIKPLKILVLGFSLPDSMFAGLAREPLKWYWTTTLARAVAAREISEQLFQTPGDEAFLAGLLQGLGLLVFAKQIGPSYAVMLIRSSETGLDLRQLETEAFGFDHIELTTALLHEWHMPRQLVEAIGSQHDPRALAKEHRLNNPIARILHLANLTGELVGQHRLSALPDLLEAGELYCDLTKAQLHELIVSLQPKVGHLAEVLSIDVCHELDFVQVLIAAHEQMSELTESVFAPSEGQAVDPLLTTDSLWQEAVQLRAVMDGFLQRPVTDVETSAPPAKLPAQMARQQSAQQQWPSQFVHWITLIAATCRSRRQPLSVVMIDISDDTPDIDDNESVIAQLLDATCREEFPTNTLMERNAAWRRTVVLPMCDKQAAVRLAQGLIRNVEGSLSRLANSSRTVQGVISVGVASVTLPSKSFRPLDLLSTADRCLSAARTSETSVVKSLEIY